MSVTAISAALSSLKSLQDLAKSMISRRDAAAFEAKMIEFQSKIIDTQSEVLAAQEERSAFLTRIGSLEKEVADLKTWETEKERYQLKAFEFGIFAYALKPEAQISEPPNLLCANCFQHGQKSILQGTAELKIRRRVHVCPTCKTEVFLSGSAIDSSGGSVSLGSHNRE